MPSLSTTSERFSHLEAPASLKVALREEARRLRGALSAAQIHAGARQICARVLRERLLARCRCVAAYVAMEGECDVAPLVAALMRRGVRVVLPRVTGPGQMVFAPMHGPRAPLADGPWGLRQPITEAIALEEIDAILVPGIAFDRFGGRLGFGGGFYDRLLGRTRAMRHVPPAYGVGYAWQVVSGRLPVEAHDERLDGVIAPGQVARFRRR